VSRLGSFRFSHELIRDVVYTELGAARQQVLHQRALALLQSEGARASELAVHARASGEAEEAYRSSVQAGDEAVAVFAVEEAIGHYEQAPGSRTSCRPRRSNASMLIWRGHMPTRTPGRKPRRPMKSS
jgi:hypothetical protein